MLAKIIAKQTNTEPEEVDPFAEEEHIAGDEHMADVSMDSTQKKKPDQKQKPANNSKKKYETAIIEDFDEEEKNEEDDYN